MVRAEIIVKGRVQKAGYRDFIDEKAFRYNLKGYVENLKDGSVKIICEGEEEDIKSFIREINIQKYPILVQDMEVEYKKATDEFSTFDIKRGDPNEEIFSSLDMAAHYLREMNQNLGGKIDTLDRNLGGKMSSLEKGLTALNDNLGSKLELFREDTKNHFDALGSKYHTISENLIKITENNRQTSENLNKLVGLVETLVKERSTKK